MTGSACVNRGDRDGRSVDENGLEAIVKFGLIFA